jgi:hypothetical protein
MPALYGRQPPGNVAMVLEGADNGGCPCVFTSGVVVSLLRNLYRRLPVIRELQAIAAFLRTIEQHLRDMRSNATLSLTDFQMHGHPRYGDKKRLFSYQAQVCSQNGEDGIIQEIFRRIGTQNKRFLEIGVGDGTENNTAFLLSQGWTGFWIDGCGDFLPNLDRFQIQHAIKPHVGCVTAENLHEILAKLGVPQDLDLLSLDIDQNTHVIWEQMSAYRPRLAVIEYNAVLPAAIDWKASYNPNRVWDGSHNFGASLKCLENIGRKLGYSLVGCDLYGVNAFFVRDDLLGDHFEGPFTAEHHYEPPRYTLTGKRGHGRGILDGTPTHK